MIYAAATPPGKSGVAVYRLSGPTVAPALEALGVTTTPKPRHATLVMLVDQQTQQPIDQALALYFPAPHSFTGEDVLELHTHGGRAVRDSLFTCLGRIEHCRLAEPGEFSRRAFAHGKMDLLQAEGVADLIHAETAKQQQRAIAQLSGSDSEHYTHLRQLCLRAMALLEAWIDFPDEEIPETTVEEVSHLIQTLKNDIVCLLESAAGGQLMRDGVSVVIAGPPNAGKSTLLNALAKRDIAITSDIAGTTRDRIATHLDIDGYLVELTDTAGLRETADPLEREGIRRSREAIDEADILIAIIDLTRSGNTEELDQLVALNKPMLVLLNKRDLVDAPPNTLIDALHPIPTLALSLTEPGAAQSVIAHLGNHIANLAQKHENPPVTRQRHIDALHQALHDLAACDLALPIELLADHLRAAGFALGKITGHIETDHLLDVIFHEFCIGK